MKATDEDWMRYDALMSKLGEEFDDKTAKENTDERLKIFYNTIEEAVVTLFDKKKNIFVSDQEKNDKIGNKIPREI